MPHHEHPQDCAEESQLIDSQARLPYMARRIDEKEGNGEHIRSEEAVRRGEEPGGSNEKHSNLEAAIVDDLSYPPFLYTRVL